MSQLDPMLVKDVIVQVGERQKYFDTLKTKYQTAIKNSIDIVKKDNNILKDILNDTEIKKQVKNDFITDHTLTPDEIEHSIYPILFEIQTIRDTYKKLILDGKITRTGLFNASFMESSSNMMGKIILGLRSTTLASVTLLAFLKMWSVYMISKVTAELEGVEAEVIYTLRGVMDKNKLIEIFKKPEPFEKLQLDTLTPTLRTTIEGFKKSYTNILKNQMEAFKTNSWRLIGNLPLNYVTEGLKSFFKISGGIFATGMLLAIGKSLYDATTALASDVKKINDTNLINLETVFSISANKLSNNIKIAYALAENKQFLLNYKRENNPDIQAQVSRNENIQNTRRRQMESKEQIRQDQYTPILNFNDIKNIDDFDSMLKEVKELYVTATNSTQYYWNDIQKDFFYNFYLKVKVRADYNNTKLKNLYHDLFYPNYLPDEKDAVFFYNDYKTLPKQNLKKEAKLRTAVKPIKKGIAIVLKKTTTEDTIGENLWGENYQYINNYINSKQKETKKNKDKYNEIQNKRNEIIENNKIQDIIDRTKFNKKLYEHDYKGKYFSDKSTIDLKVGELKKLKIKMGGVMFKQIHLINDTNLRTYTKNFIEEIIYNKILKNEQFNKKQEDTYDNKKKYIESDIFYQTIKDRFDDNDQRKKNIVNNLFYKKIQKQFKKDWDEYYMSELQKFQTEIWNVIVKKDTGLSNKYKEIYFKIQLIFHLRAFQLLSDKDTKEQMFRSVIGQNNYNTQSYIFNLIEENINLLYHDDQKIININSQTGRVSVSKKKKNEEIKIRNMYKSVLFKFHTRTRTFFENRNGITRKEGDKCSYNILSNGIVEQKTTNLSKLFTIETDINDNDNDKGKFENLIGDYWLSTNEWKWLKIWSGEETKRITFLTGVLQGDLLFPFVGVREVYKLLKENKSTLLPCVNIQKRNIDNDKFIIIILDDVCKGNIVFCGLKNEELFPFTESYPIDLLNFEESSQVEESLYKFVQTKYGDREIISNICFRGIQIEDDKIFIKHKSNVENIEDKKNVKKFFKSVSKGLRALLKNEERTKIKMIIPENMNYFYGPSNTKNLTIQNILPVIKDYEIMSLINDNHYISGTSTKLPDEFLVSRLLEYLKTDIVKKLNDAFTILFKKMFDTIPEIITMTKEKLEEFVEIKKVRTGPQTFKFLKFNDYVVDPIILVFFSGPVKYIVYGDMWFVSGFFPMFKEHKIKFEYNHVEKNKIMNFGDISEDDFDLFKDVLYTGPWTNYTARSKLQFLKNRIFKGLLD